MSIFFTPQRKGPKQFVQDEHTTNNSRMTVTKSIVDEDLCITPLRDPRSPSPVGERRTPGATCQALRHAVNSLYRLDDFHREDLGHGFFSEVYKVRHKTTGEVMVLKLNTSLNNRPNMLREVQLMNRMAHPNILKFMGVCVHEGQLHALTEYISAGCLEEVLAAPRELPWPTRIKLAADVARGMAYLHARGIMHRDLTSKNVLIKREEERLTGVVGDFGLACKIPTPLDERLPTVGSPYWMAPECIQSQKYSEKADVFSFGIIVCEIIARVEADPDILPRTSHFGLDYVAFSKMVEDCPLNFLHMAFNCCQIDPKKRPAFADIVQQVDEIKSRSQMAIVLADISNVHIGADEVMNKTILERILDGRGHRRNRSDETVRFRTPDPDGEDLLEGHMIPVTPLVVGEVMSKDDAFYTPHKDNPFLAKFKDCKAKLVGSLRENWNSWFELPSPTRGATPPCTPDDVVLRSARPARNCHSLPGSPVLARKEIDRYQFEAAHYSAAVAARRTFSVMTSLRKLELEEQDVLASLRRLELEEAEQDASFDARSESSNDSGMDMLIRDLRSARDSMRKQFGRSRHLSLDPASYSQSVGSPGSSAGGGGDSRLLARCLEARFMDSRLLESPRLHPAVNPFLSGRATSYSSSESCMSLDEVSLLSPTSSYSDVEADALTKAQMELYEHRLRSRQKFQELMSRWEAKEAAMEQALDQMSQSSAAAAHHADPHLEKKFQELKRKWEMNQLSASWDAAAKATKLKK